MVCPFCQAEETSVVDSRKNSEGTSIRRRRSCISCKTRFTTYEKASIGLIVVKRNGNREEFNIDKLYSGVKNAFGGQELSEKKLKNFSAKLKNQGSRNDFIVNLERLYNHNTPADKKIRLELYEYNRN